MAIKNAVGGYHGPILAGGGGRGICSDTDTYKCNTPSLLPLLDDRPSREVGEVTWIGTTSICFRYPTEEFTAVFKWICKPFTSYHLSDAIVSDSSYKYERLRAKFEFVHSCSNAYVYILTKVFNYDILLEAVELPDYTSVLNSCVKGMFYNCPNLEWVFIPDSWKIIHDPRGMFINCPNLKIKNIRYPSEWNKYSHELIVNEHELIVNEHELIVNEEQSENTTIEKEIKNPIDGDKSLRHATWTFLIMVLLFGVLYVKLGDTLLAYSPMMLSGYIGYHFYRIHKYQKIENEIYWGIYNPPNNTENTKPKEKVAVTPTITAKKLEDTNLSFVERCLEKILHITRLICCIIYVFHNFREFVEDKNKLKNIFKDL